MKITLVSSIGYKYTKGKFHNYMYIAGSTLGLIDEDVQYLIFSTQYEIYIILVAILDLSYLQWVFQ